ncbi:YjbF family lipoprotein [Tateyamaria armeniaca]|uniref:YjbF family lipoprotein n=1 Tax=Tateyamaria armeniaca TaxID=2518930 RepID=A0ABW8UPW2_9RHOB
MPALTPQFLAGLKTPTLEVTLERTGTVAILSLYSDRLDPELGELRTWRSADGSQLVFREGVLIATRGLGNDIGSTQATSMIKLLTLRTPSAGLHQIYVVTGENGTERVDLACDMTVVGPETLEIVQRLIKTLRLRAECAAGSNAVTYNFWVDPEDSTVWQSRQWAGPSLGYMKTRLLKK